MNAGRLKQKIKFFDYTKVSDGAGGFTSTPSLVLETIADIKAVRSEKTLEHLQEGLNQAFQIKLRMRRGFNPKQSYTVEYRGEQMKIVKIESDEFSRKEWTLIVVGREN